MSQINLYIFTTIMSLLEALVSLILPKFVKNSSKIAKVVVVGNQKSTTFPTTFLEFSQQFQQLSTKK